MSVSSYILQSFFIIVLFGNVKHFYKLFSIQVSYSGFMGNLEKEIQDILRVEYYGIQGPLVCACYNNNYDIMFLLKTNLDSIHKFNINIQNIMS